MSINSAFIYHPQTLNYKFNEHHPFNQKRLTLTIDLLKKSGALNEENIITPNPASDESIHAVHQTEFIQAVKGLSSPSPSTKALSQAEKFGLDKGDTPYFINMHEITSIVAGGSIEASKQVMSGQYSHALHLGGGLHHAMPDRSAGFCVYNDAAIAIQYIRKNYGAKVLFVDTDVHHGDGVQWSFYADPEVFTFSIHETGKYLFPGTGYVTERGEDSGFGFNLNLPMEPYTEDESWLKCFSETLERIVKSFRPDVIVSLHGCDAHVYDPLSHIHCSMDIYLKMPQIIHNLAHEYCNGQWIALGGGGYDIYRVVPRAWSLLWMVMSEHPLIHSLIEKPNLILPEAWIQQWQKESPKILPNTWLDKKEEWDPMPRRAEITKQNEKTKEIALTYC
ncbi:acetoin utilization protein AcuC [Chengkuizengella marina]|uniref:Acetoin utilization protein AcuC n=1 Tax=Chengkuizengella marina TaxID=2507566 RepID=A0A6N9Q460_9BACL|nr:acetoin utilization protein AcuC [Chengkuizengella marina]NBI29592.1 acetoin utilization protein AcuC [Chengkuizengella marina]